MAVAGSLVLAGTFDAATSQMLTVTSDGTAAGFAVGSNLPAAAAGNTDYFVIVTTGASYSPPGGGGPYAVGQGDWLLSTGTAWQYLNVGYDPTPDSDSVAGVIRVALPSEVEAGANNNIAISPLGGEATYLKKSLFTGAGYLLTATASGTPVALAPGSNDQVLTVDTTCIATGCLK